MFLKWNYRNLKTTCNLMHFQAKGFSADKNLIVNVLNSTIEGAKINSVNEWKNVRESLLTYGSTYGGKFSEQNIDATILNYCLKNREIERGFLYLEFLTQENIKKNLATLGKFFKLLYCKNEDKCIRNGEKCPTKDEELIIKSYSDLRKDYPLLDSYTLENTIQALSLTKDWKHCLKLLNEFRISAVPTSYVYSAIISAAFLHNEDNLGFELLTQSIENDRLPQTTCYLSYISSLNKIKNRDRIIVKLEKLFNFFKKYDIKCKQEVLQQICNVVDKENFAKKFVKLNIDGICPNCNNHFEKFELTDEEFENLKNNFFEKVIIGKNVFIKTNPEELETFKAFMNRKEKYDVILDGLNVAYSAGTNHSPQVFSAIVVAVVSYFVKQNKKVLVLGRAHMSRWPKKNWEYVTNNATVFLTQNVSQDDPYLLYCALNSGKDTIVVTRDLMRGHKFLLKEPKDKLLFGRWLSMRQYQLIRVNNSYEPIFKKPPPFSIMAQKNGNIWHIPYEPEESEENINYHQTWFCMQT